MENINRKSNFELLRIIAIIMILILHYLNGNMGGALKETVNSTSNYYIIRFIESFCIIAVNCFVLITGYFMIDKIYIKVGKLTNLVLVSIFYSCILYIISIVLRLQNFSIGGLINALIFIYDSKWFIYAYISLYLLIPYLNKIILDFNQYEYRKMLFLLITLFSLIPTIFPKISFNDSGYGILTFITLYFIGGYLRLYYKANKRKVYYLAIYILCSIVTGILVFEKFEINVWWNYNSIINVVSSISLFLFFLKIDIRSNLINYISKYTFSIYIIHSDSSICNFLYRDMFKSEKYWNNPEMILNMGKCVLGIYIGCIFIDIIRNKVFEIIMNGGKNVEKFFEKNT